MKSFMVVKKVINLGMDEIFLRTSLTTIRLLRKFKVAIITMIQRAHLKIMI